MENLNIFSSKGFITRSGFFAAYLIISLVISFFSMLGRVFASESSGEFNFICYLIAIIGCLMGTYLILANLIKRINDIKEKKFSGFSYLYLISFLDSSSYFGSFLSNDAISTALFYYHLAFLLFIVALSLIKGKNKTNYPPFSFAAFFGTIFWGLYNRCYIPLLFIFYFLLFALSDSHPLAYLLASFSFFPLGGILILIFLIIIITESVFSIPVIKFMFIMGILGNRLIKNYNPKVQKIDTAFFMILFFLVIVPLFCLHEHLAPGFIIRILRESWPLIPR